MKTLVRTNYTKWYMLIGLFVLIIAFAGTSLAAHTITVTVGVSKNLVAKHPVSAIGYSIDARHGERSEGAYSAVGSDFLPSVSDCKKSLRAVKSFESPCVVEP